MKEEEEEEEEGEGRRKKVQWVSGGDLVRPETDLTQCTQNNVINNVIYVIIAMWDCVSFALV